MTGINETPGQATLPSTNSTKSFWHSEPSHILLGHRTTAALPTKAEVIIIGSGIAGVFAAHYLRESERGKGLNIVMLEAREACWGATGRNGGHCQPLIYSRFPEIAAFELRNFLTLKALVDKHEIACEWRNLHGVHTYLNQDLFDEALGMVKSLKEMSPELAKLVTTITKESKDPSLEDLRTPTAAGAFIQKYAASLWPYKLVAWVLGDLLSRNEAHDPKFNLQTNTPVTHLQKTDDGTWLVHTSRGMIASKNVIVATNGYTSHLLGQFSDLIVPVRGEMSSLLPPTSMKPGSENPPLSYSYGIIGHGDQNMNQDDYLIQRSFATGGELMFGGGRRYASQAGIGISDDSSIDESAAAYLRRELNVVLDLKSDVSELEATYEWSGIMGYSRDQRPWVGEVKEELGLGGGDGLWVCGGFTGHGMPNAVLCAKAVVGLMLREEEVDLPELYSLSRYRVEKAREKPEVRIADAGL